MKVFGYNLFGLSLVAAATPAFGFQGRSKEHQATACFTRLCDTWLSTLPLAVESWLLVLAASVMP